MKQTVRGQSLGYEAPRKMAESVADTWLCLGNAKPASQQTPCMLFAQIWQE